MADRYIGLNTDDRIGMLRRAWMAAPDGASSLLGQLQLFAKDSSEDEEDDIQSSSSNSHTSTSQQPGMATAARAEKTRAWYQLIEAYQSVRLFLRNCSKYGYDAFEIAASGQFQKGTAIEDEEARVIVDNNGDWEMLVDKYGDDHSQLAQVVGVKPDDAAVYLWLLNNPVLLSPQRGATESRHSYADVIIGRSGAQYYA